MVINDKRIFEKSKKIITELFGSNAEFRDGQYEAIEATVKKQRTLVVQRTGWGKSLVYFACTRLNRDEGKGVTLVISPLLVLMQNQLEAASRLNLKCEALNSTTKERRLEIIEKMKNNSLDLVLVTPETLFSEDVQNEMDNIKIGLMVIDEAHCISDWGHDFRLEYGRLREVIRRLPSDVPILATTATANNRVIEDLKEQLGGDVYVSRGPLTRESLAIQILNMPSKVERYAWILENINKLNGSGIIYCLTKRDCDHLAAFLCQNGISAMAYYSESGKEDECREAEEKFRNNEIKAIVATIKLGMGYDKGDISFVIHYQMPSSIVSYYQQIGRAGRSIDNASVFLMCGKEDATIINYFIDIIFPSEQDARDVLELIENSPKGIKARKIEATLNISKRKIQRTLEFLENDGVIKKEKYAYIATGKELFYDKKRYDAITDERRKEAKQMQALTSYTGCFSQYIVNCIDDLSARPCGKCTACTGKSILPEEVSLESKEKASRYINRLVYTIVPRKMWLPIDEIPASKIELVNKEGICMSLYGEVGYGATVKRDIEENDYISDEILKRSVQLLAPLASENKIECITFVPSLKRNAVKDFALRLAGELGIEFRELLEKKSAPRQSEMENGIHKCANAYASFEAKTDTSMPKKLILVDDTVDSKWTLTVCGYKLMQAGSEEIYPYALADNGD